MRLSCFTLNNSKNLFIIFIFSILSHNSNIPLKNLCVEIPSSMTLIKDAHTHIEKANLFLYFSLNSCNSIHFSLFYEIFIAITGMEWRISSLLQMDIKFSFFLILSYFSTEWVRSREREREIVWEGWEMYEKRIDKIMNFHALFVCNTYPLNVCAIIVMAYSYAH